MKNYYMADRGDLVGFLGPGGRYKAALDIGCSSGTLGKVLLEQNIAEQVDGIEIYAEAAEIARSVLRNVWTGSVETLSDRVDWDAYDLIVMADVLEHLVDPWAILAFLHSRCKPGCQFLLSVPNARHHSVWGPLVFQGAFEYRDSGIMDRTHLHFFTRLSLQHALEKVDWKVQRIAPNIKAKYRKWWYPYRVLEEFLAVQYFVMASK